MLRRRKFICNLLLASGGGLAAFAAERETSIKSGPPPVSYEDRAVAGLARLYFLHRDTGFLSPRRWVPCATRCSPANTRSTNRASRKLKCGRRTIRFSATVLIIWPGSFPLTRSSPTTAALAPNIATRRPNSCCTGSTTARTGPAEWDSIHAATIAVENLQVRFNSLGNGAAEWQCDPARQLSPVRESPHAHQFWLRAVSLRLQQPVPGVGFLESPIGYQQPPPLGEGSCISPSGRLSAFKQEASA